MWTGGGGFQGLYVPCSAPAHLRPLPAAGTTGNPKGVMYTHRSNLLHALVTTLPDALSLGSASTV